MASFEEEVVPHSGRTARKRSLAPTEWVKTKVKQRKYASDGSVPKVSCKHSDGRCMAYNLTAKDCKRFHKLFYERITKVEQDSFITKALQVQTVKRVRGKQNQRNRAFSVTHFIQAEDGNQVKVCAQSFCSILRVNAKRVQRLAAYYFKHGVSRGENRGGKRRNARIDGIKDLIRQHILTFKCCSAHYGRDKVS